MPNSVPHPCHTSEKAAVMSSHSKALQTKSELGTSRPALTAKCSPKQSVTRCWLCVAELSRIRIKAAPLARRHRALRWDAGRRPGTGAQHDRSGTTLWRIDSLIAAISVALPGMRVLPVKAIVFPADSPRSTTVLQKTRRIDEPTMGLQNREA
jgi:hypothetical protein